MDKNIEGSLKLIMGLLNICEEMLFSICLKGDIVKRYQTLRENTLEKIGLYDNFSRFLDCQEKAVEQARKKKSLSEMEKSILRKTIEEQNGKLTKTLIMFSNFISNFKSNLEEAGTQDSEDLLKYSISTDITNYSSELQKFDSFLQYFSSHQILLQKQCKFQQDSLNNLSCENLRLRTASEHIQKTYEDSFLVLEKKYHSKVNKSDSRANELEISFHEKESSLMDQIDKITVQDASVLKDLREKLEKSQSKNQDFRFILRELVERVSSLFNEYIDKDEISEHFALRKSEISKKKTGKTWENQADLFTELDFVGFALHKLKGDNDWLIEQLDLFCKENEDLKRELTSFPKSKKVESVFKSLNTNEVAIKDFTEARNKLIKQFKETDYE